MNDRIEKLIKIQGILNTNKFHLAIATDLLEKADWRLFQVFDDYKKYMSSANSAILDSETDSIEELIDYLEKHNGFSRRW